MKFQTADSKENKDVTVIRIKPIFMGTVALTTFLKISHICKCLWESSSRDWMLTLSGHPKLCQSPKQGHDTSKVPAPLKR